MANVSSFSLNDGAIEFIVNDGAIEFNLNALVSDIESNFRLLENDDIRKTEDGNFRILE